MAGDHGMASAGAAGKSPLVTFCLVIDGGMLGGFGIGIILDIGVDAAAPSAYGDGGLIIIVTMDDLHVTMLCQAAD